MPGNKPPTSVANNAKRGLELRKKFNRGGTAVGVARARDLSNRKEIPIATIKRMKAYFDRHQVDKKAKDWNAPSAGKIAWLLWGGDSGYAWAKSIVNKVEASFIVQAYDLFAELTPEQKKQVDEWKYPFETNQFSNHVFGDKNRVTEPLDASVKPKVKPVKKHIQNHLLDKGYKLPDPTKNHVIDKYDRPTTIGKALIRSKAPQKMIDEVANHFQPVKKKNDLSITYSRDPYDVAGMSTNRGWTSCLNMDRSGSQGIDNSEFLPKEINEGTHVAYLHHHDDPDLQHPIARIALKKFVSHSGHAVLRPENVMYGSGPSIFEDQVDRWAEKHFPLKDELYKMTPGVYNDTLPYTLRKRKSKSELLDDLKSKSKSVSNGAAQELIDRHPETAKTMLGHPMIRKNIKYFNHRHITPELQKAHPDIDWEKEFWKPYRNGE